MRLGRTLSWLCALTLALVMTQSCASAPSTSDRRGDAVAGAVMDSARRDGVEQEPRQRDAPRPRVLPRAPVRDPIDVPGLGAGPRVTDLGPASLVTATMVGDQVGGLVYVATNGVSPVTVGAYDPVRGRVTRTYRLPSGTGAWAMTHVGTDLYVGVYGPGHLYRIDTVRHTVTKVAEMGSWIWSITAAPDGVLFAGTYPTGEVYSYDPSTGETGNLGAAVEGEKYVRSIAATESTVYAGVGTAAHLIAIDRDSGERRDLLPDAYTDSTFVNALSLAPDGNTLAAGLTPSGPVLLFDLRSPGRSKPQEVPIGDGEFASALQIGDDGDLYLGARPSGTLYRYDRVERTLEPLGTPYDGATTYRILPDDGAVRAVVESGVVEYDRDTRELDTVALSRAGLDPGPELPMALAVLDNGQVLVSGKYGLQVHDPSTGSAWRLQIPGEAKAITPVPGVPGAAGRNGRGDEPEGPPEGRAGAVQHTTGAFLSVYTQARVLHLDPARGVLLPLFETGHQQTRPTDAVYVPERDALLVATEPDYGRRDGALTVYQNDGGDVETYRGVVPEQTVLSVTADGDEAYLGGSVRNGLGTDPTTETALLTAFSLRTREVLWRAEPVPGAEAITDLVVSEGRVHGVTGDGRLFEFDPGRRETLSVLRPGEDRSTLVQAGGRLYGTDGDRIYRVDPRPSGPPAVETVVDGLNAQWYGGSPLLAAAPGGEALYALRDRDLVRIRLGS